MPRVVPTNRRSEYRHHRTTLTAMLHQVERHDGQQDKVAVLAWLLDATDADRSDRPTPPTGFRRTIDAWLQKFHQALSIGGDRYRQQRIINRLDAIQWGLERATRPSK